MKVSINTFSTQLQGRHLSSDISVKVKTVYCFRYQAC